MAVLALNNREAAGDRPVSGSGMDRVVEVKRFSPRAKIAATAAGAVLAASLFWWYAPSSSSQTLAADRVTISEVRRGSFEDFVPLRARVTPLVTVYLDAIEGGRVEKVLVEDGTSVTPGQPLAVLSNAELQLSVLARQTEVEQQINNMRTQELALAQTRLANERAVLEAELAATKVGRQYQREAPLAARGFVAGKQFTDTRDELAYQQRRVAALKRGQTTDARLQGTQLAELRRSAASMRSGLQFARSNLDALNLRAPVAGQLSGFAIQVGQSVERGARIGQIDSSGRNKLVAGVDEFYLGRVALNQRAAIEIAGKRYMTRVTKIYPQVKDGQFEVDLQFLGDEPAGLQRGQTVQTKLSFGDPAPALLVPNGSFYNDTGGSWVFVVAADGRSAEKRPVRLGRRNTDAIEVLDGLQPGERVLTSSYTGLTDKDRLSIAAKD